jgi:glycosyltransferase involved in cell wall biosynthesis
MPELPFPYVNAGRLHDPHQVAALMSSADVLLDASRWQAFGRPGLESMACGTAPVLTNVGGLHEYAEDGANSLLVPPEDPEAAAAAVVRLLDDRALRERLAAEGLRTAARFTIANEVDRHEALLRRWTREARRGRR